MPRSAVTGIPAVLKASISRWMVRSDTSRRCASSRAVMRPCACKISRIESSRSARIDIFAPLPFFRHRLSLYHRNMTRIVKKCRANPCPLSLLLPAHGYALATTVSWIYNCEQSAISLPTEPQAERGTVGRAKQGGMYVWGPSDGSSILMWLRTLMDGVASKHRQCWSHGQRIGQRVRDRNANWLE